MRVVTMEKKETKVEKVKGFFKRHEDKIVTFEVYATMTGALVGACLLGYIWRGVKINAGLQRMFDVNPDLETGFLSTFKQIQEIDEQRITNYK